MSLLVVAPLAAMLAFQPQVAVQGTTSVTLHHASATAHGLHARALHLVAVLKVGQEWEGLISKITDYGFFCKLGHEATLASYIRTLTPERLPRRSRNWIEEVAGRLAPRCV